MSLKSLVQLFAEKFLVRKQEWIASRRNITISRKTSITLPNSMDVQKYTPPADGILSIGQNTSGHGYIEVNASGARLNLDQSQTKTYYQGVCIQVVKGGTITFKAYGENRGDSAILEFSPFVSQP